MYSSLIRYGGVGKVVFSVIFIDGDVLIWVGDKYVVRMVVRFNGSCES